MIQWDAAAEHVADGDLARFMDGECSPEQEHDVRRHLHQCDSCRERLDVLVRTSAKLSDQLAAMHDESVPGERQRRPHFVKRAAQLIGAAAVVAIVTPPLLAWLSGRSVEESAVAAVISFEPQGSVFTIELPHHQAAGTLTLFIDSVGAVTTRVLGEGASPELMVLRDGLRIGNATESRMSYEVTLPDQLGEVRVTVEGMLVLRRRVAPDDAEWTINLAAARE